VQALATRGFAYGECGERRPITLYFPKRGTPRAPRSILVRACCLVPRRVDHAAASASSFPTSRAAHSRAHLPVAQDGAADEEFCTSVVREQARAAEVTARGLAEPLLRWAENREIGPSFQATT
jgi:hypothetical protein